MEAKWVWHESKMGMTVSNSTINLLQLILIVLKVKRSSCTCTYIFISLSLSSFRYTRCYHIVLTFVTLTCHTHRLLTIPLEGKYSNVPQLMPMHLLSTAGTHN